MFYNHLKPHLEALLFAAGDPISAAQLATILEIPEDHVRLLLAELKNDLNSAERGITLVEVAGGYQLVTKGELAATVEKLAGVQDSRLSLPALETLAIIAYKQPITRGEIDFIRGVQSDSVLATLLDKGLIKELGRKEGPGRPILYGTTDTFLLHFGLNSINELPKFEDFNNNVEEFEE